MVKVVKLIVVIGMLIFFQTPCMAERIADDFSGSQINQDVWTELSTTYSNLPKNPGICIGTGGVFHSSFPSQSFTEAHVVIWDHDGINDDGSSHTVVMETPTDTSHELFFGHKISNVSAVYRFWVETKPVDGDYTFTVTDSYGQSASVTDHQTTKNVPSVDINTLDIYHKGATPTFRWRPLNDAVYTYRINIRDENEYFNWWSSGFNEPEITVPPGILEPHTTYKIRIIADFEWAWVNLQNISFSGDKYFTTGNTTYDPFIAFNEVGSNPVLSRWDSLVFNATIFDVGGVPDNIEKVEVVFPDGMTRERLYFRFENNLGGWYQSHVLPTAPLSGTYTFHVQNKDGRIYERSTDFTYNPLPEPDWTQTIPADGTVISSDSILIDWPDVSGAATYHLTVYDKYHNVYYDKWVDKSKHSFSRGILREGETYFYMIYAQREGLIYQNYLRTWERAENRFILSPLYGGTSSPEFESTWVGFATADVGGRPEVNYLEFSATVSDADGLQNVKEVRVEAPNGNVYSLNKINILSDNSAKFWTLVEPDYMPSSGTYRFSATDFDGNTALISRNHNVSPLERLHSDQLSPAHNETVGLPLTISWSHVQGASSYQIDLYDSLGMVRVKQYRNITNTSFTIPPGDIASGSSYRYRIYAWDDNFDNFSTNQRFWSLCPAFHVQSYGVEVTITPVTSNTVSFGDIINVGDDISWLWLWTGNQVHGRYVGSYVNTSSFNSSGGGWIEIRDLDNLKLDFAQYDNTILYVLPWASGKNFDWQKFEVNFQASDQVKNSVNLNITQDTPASEVFKVENVQAGTHWLQLWIGGNLDTSAFNSYGNGWIEARDLSRLVIKGDALSGGDSLWVRQYSQSPGSRSWVDYGWLELKK